MWRPAGLLLLAAAVACSDGGSPEPSGEPEAAKAIGPSSDRAEYYAVMASTDCGQLAIRRDVADMRVNLFIERAARQRMDDLGCGPNGEQGDVPVDPPCEDGRLDVVPVASRPCLDRQPVPV
jgi:hypothetical protein